MSDPLNQVPASEQFGLSLIPMQSVRISKSTLQSEQTRTGVMKYSTQQISSHVNECLRIHQPTIAEIRLERARAWNVYGLNLFVVISIVNSPIHVNAAFYRLTPELNRQNQRIQRFFRPFDLINVYVTETTAKKNSDEVWFNERADRWEKEARIHSSPGAKIIHKDYISIMARGKTVAPFIFKRLKTSGLDWCWALERIFDPENPGDGINNYQGKVKAWLEWGKERHLV